MRREGKGADKEEKKIKEDEGAAAKRTNEEGCGPIRALRSAHVRYMATGDSPGSPVTTSTFPHSARHSLCFHFSSSNLCTSVCVCSRHQITDSICVCCIRTVTWCLTACLPDSAAHDFSSWRYH
jgi:hypothetical protein